MFSRVVLCHLESVDAVKNKGLSVSGVQFVLEGKGYATTLVRINAPAVTVKIWRWGKYYMAVVEIKGIQHSLTTERTPSETLQRLAWLDFDLQLALVNNRHANVVESALAKFGARNVKRQA